MSFNAKKSQRQILIEKAINNRLSRFEVNKILVENNLSELKSSEADCYDVVLDSIISSNPRQKIISACLAQGLSKTEANLELYNNKFRWLSDGEGAYYEDVLGRIRYCDDSFIINIVRNTKKKLSYEEVIRVCISRELSFQEANKNLVENGYEKMSISAEVSYRKKYNEFHNKRQSIIQRAFENCKSVFDVNKELKNNELSELSMVEEINYQKEREHIQNKKRDNLIQECLEENLELYQFDIILNQNGFDRLSEQEMDKLNSAMHSKGVKKTKKKTTELSNQFRTLYRKATKFFHPDKFDNEEQKNKATLIMKEINEAKEKNDYFLLKELFKKYENNFK